MHGLDLRLLVVWGGGTRACSGRLDSIIVIVLPEEEEIVEIKDSPDHGRAVRVKASTARRDMLLQCCLLQLMAVMDSVCVCCSK